MSDDMEMLSVDDADLPIGDDTTLPEGVQLLLTIEPAEWDALNARIAALEAERDAARSALAESRAHAARLARAVEATAPFLPPIDPTAYYTWKRVAAVIPNEQARELAGALAATPADSLARLQAAEAVAEWAEDFAEEVIFPDPALINRLRAWHDAARPTALAALDGQEGGR